MPRNPSGAPTALANDPSGPMRTCVGCRGRESRSVLVRVVAEGGLAVVDVTKDKPGRGAWLHPNQECLAQALQRRAFGRALRAPEVDASGITLE